MLCSIRKNPYIYGWANYAMLLGLTLYCVSLVIDYTCTALFELGISLDLAMMLYHGANACATIFFSFFIYRWSVRMFVLKGEFLDEKLREGKPHPHVERKAHPRIRVAEPR